MTFLPIVGRELRVAARKRSTWLARCGVAAVALVIGSWILLIPEFRRPGMMGPAMFVPLAAFVFLYSLFGGLWTTADSLSEEKREGTLGLLFLTDLKGHDVVLGKLAATSLNVCYGLLAVFPVMAIPLLAGGVSVDEFLRVIVAALNCLYFSLATGLFCSSLCRDERKAGVLAIAIVVTITAVIPIVGMIYADRRPGPMQFEAAVPFVIASPGMACVLAFDDPFRALPSKSYYHVSLVTVFGLATLMLFLACRIVPRSWQERAVSARGSRWRAFWDNWRFGHPARRRRFRTRVLAANPFYWLASREINKPRLVWLFLAALGALWLLWCIDWDSLERGYFRLTRTYIGPESKVSTALIAHTFLKIWITVEAGRRLCVDRRSNALELLLTTPLTVRRIITGQLVALERQFALPLLGVLVADLLFLLSDTADKDWVALWVCGIVAFIADIITLPLLAMWHALRARDTNRAAAAAIVRVMVLPWLIWAMGMVAGISLSFALGSGAPHWMDHGFPLAFWLTLSLAANLVFGLPAWIRLNIGFREMAARRFEPKRRWFFRDTRPPALPAQSPS